MLALAAMPYLRQGIDESSNLLLTTISIASIFVVVACFFGIIARVWQAIILWRQSQYFLACMLLFFALGMFSGVVLLAGQWGYISPG